MSIRLPVIYDLSRRSFAAICSTLRLRCDPRAVHQALRVAWREPQRHYHRSAHLRACLGVLQQWQQHARNPAEIGFALWFHDAVYVPQASDNEARSAQWAQDVLRAAGADAYLCRRVVELIMATAHASELAHSDGTDPDTDLDLLLDIDLSVLASSPSAYQRYRGQIRREYSWVAPAQYRAARARVLHAFLAQPSIYRSAPGQCLEQAARNNLHGELRVLNAVLSDPGVDQTG